jgi:peptide/nickel transport system substrate-binding protein/oligopeptide transport system substrate-binding protein
MNPLFRFLRPGFTPALHILATAFFAACVYHYAAGRDRSQTATPVNSLGVTLPEDAAPLDQQELVMFVEERTHMEWFRTVYKSSTAMHVVSEPLMRVNHHFDLIPAAAERWEVSEEGLLWTFHIRPGLQFSDNAPLTAHDFVYTFRRGADPDNAYDFEWYYHPIKNWADVVARRIPVEEIGVRALDDRTLQFTLEHPTPYFPYLIFYSWVTPRRAVEKYGDNWSARQETSIASGPYRLREWIKSDRMVLDLNTAYRGPIRPYLERILYKLYIVAAQPPFLPAYEAVEVDYIPIENQAQVARITSSPEYRDQLNSYVEFQTYYLTMDTYNSVFRDIRIRKAFSHAIDREALCNSALRYFAVPAYAMLPPGFPGASQETLADIQAYDPKKARAYLAEAGYPDGKGFPPLELWIRNEGAVQRTAAEGIQAMIRKNLNIDLSVRNMEIKVFMDALNNHRIPLAMVPYEYDYLDPSNLLGIWLSNGRHAWRNDGFERLIQRGNAFQGDRDRRMDIYRAAERMLVEDVGGIFLWHRRVNQLWRPYLESHALKPNRYGQRFWRTDKLQDLSTTMYVRNNTETSVRRRPSLFGRLRDWMGGG